MIRHLILSALALFTLISVNSPPAFAQAKAPVRVSLQTSEGVIVVELAMAKAPVTAGNFLRYVDKKKFDGTVFYRAGRTKGAAGRGLIQGGIRHNITRAFPPIAHEPTNKTGLKHVDGTISMARTTPGSAMGDFFITVGPSPAMDAKPGAAGDNAGFAAFGRVVKGMDVVRRILAAPTIPNAGRGAMKGQMIKAPVRIISARRAP